ncbi:hypothetical protein AGLY_008657 [Aphis glycines]|uniref:Uncharacterized protein n=1 Tax=Aphis glycines TaxID=307491 RepID=A0A6G0TLH3_APHGL|nr:hypothetical protein AGLY_008657 [Aphis glycines]
MEKRKFFRKTDFYKINFFYICNSKTKNCKYLKFSLSLFLLWLKKKNRYSFFFYKHLKFNILRSTSKLRKNTKKSRSVIIVILKESEFYIFTKSRNDNDLSSNDFKYLLLFKKPTNHLRSESFFLLVLYERGNMLWLISNDILQEMNQPFLLHFLTTIQKNQFRRKLVLRKNSRFSVTFLLFFSIFRKLLESSYL